MRLGGLSTRRLSIILRWLHIRVSYQGVVGMVGICFFHVYAHRSGVLCIRIAFTEKEADVPCYIQSPSLHVLYVMF